MATCEVACGLSWAVPRSKPVAQSHTAKFPKPVSACLRRIPRGPEGSVSSGE